MRRVRAVLFVHVFVGKQYANPRRFWDVSLSRGTKWKDVGVRLCVNCV